MHPKSLWDALKDDYFVCVKNEQETKILLQSCQDLGLKWYAGEDATGYDPPFDTKAITYHCGALEFSRWIDGRDKLINWSDIVFMPLSKAPKFMY